MTVREFNEQFGIGLLEMCGDSIIGISKMEDLETFYALQVDVNLGEPTYQSLDLIIDNEFLYEVDSVSMGETIYIASASLDTKVLGVEEDV